SLPLYDLGTLSDTGSEDPTISPDGTNVLLQKPSDTTDPYQWAVIVPTAGGDPKSIKMPAPVGEVSSIRWAVDGKSILYSRRENGVANIWSVPLNGNAPRKLTAFDSDQIYSFDVSVDNRLVMSHGSAVVDVVLIQNMK